MERKDARREEAREGREDWGGIVEHHIMSYHVISQSRIDGGGLIENPECVFTVLGACVCLRLVKSGVWGKLFVIRYSNATLCYAMLRYATLCYAMLRYATLCYAMLR